MAKGLPKSIIKQYGISKKAWEVYRSRKKGKRYKGVAASSRQRKKTMVRPKRRTRRYVRKGTRRRKDKRVSLIGTAGAVGSVFVPRTPSQMSMGSWLMQWMKGERAFCTEDVEHFLGDTVGQYTGFDWREGQAQWSIPWATVTLIASGIASKVANKYGSKYLKNVPVIGKYVKF